MSWKDVPVLVTGATGFTGSHLVRKLCDAGANVTAIRRSAQTPNTLADLPVRWVVGQVYDPEVIDDGMRDAVVVFHLATTFRDANAPEDLCTQVHVDSTKLLADHAKKNPAFKRFIHVSTVGVHGDVKNPPANESAPFNPGDEYQRTKAAAEQWICQYAADEGLPVSVIRPSAIYGPGDKRLLKLFKMASLPIIPLLGSGKGHYHLTHVDDLTDCMLAAATSDKAIGEAFICGHEESLSYRDLMILVAQVMGRKPKLLNLPATPFFWLGHLCEIVCHPLGIQPPIFRRRVAFFTKHRSFDTSKSRNILECYPKKTLEEGLTETFEWYRKMEWIQ